MKIFYETDRWILREIVETDIDGLFELDADPEVLKYLGNKTVSSKDQVAEMIQYIRQQYQENGIGRWAIEDKNDGQFIGWAGLKLVKEQIGDKINYYDIGYRMLKRYWGKGIATEVGHASLKYGFEQMKLEEIYASVHQENLASSTVLKKLGLQYDGDFFWDGAAHQWFKIHQTHWHQLQNQKLL